MKKLFVAFILLGLIASPCFAEQYFSQAESSSARRLFFFFLTTDGTEPATAEAGGQPQISINGGTYANTTNTISHMGYGDYLVILTQTEVGTLGKFLVRYKSANTVEFKDIGSVQNSALSTDINSLRAMLHHLINVVNWLKWKLEHETRRVKQQQQVTQE